MTELVSHVRLVDGHAEVQIGNRCFSVTRRTAQDTDTCPIELVIGALGS